MKTYSQNSVAQFLIFVKKIMFMKKTASIFVLVTLCFFSLSAQFNSKYPIKWGKVSKEEFTVKYKNDSTSPAIVLCDFGTITITNRTFYTRHIRIKINTPEGLNYTRFELPYKAYGKYDDVISFKANVFTMADGEIQKIKFGNLDKKTENIDEKTKKKIIELPEVEPGSIVEFYYEIASLDFLKLDNWYFQSSIPTLWSEIRLDIPVPFYYLVTFQNNEFLDITEQGKYAERLQWLYSAKKLERRKGLIETKNVLYQSPSGNYKVYVINNMTKKIVMKNLSGISSVKGITSMNDFYPKIRFDLFESSGRLPYFYRPLLLTTLDDYETYSRHQLRYDTRLTGYVHYRLDSWPEFNEKLLKSDRFGMRLIKHFDYIPLLDEVIKGDPQPEDKMAAVFNLVRNKIKWDGNFAYSVNRDFDKVLEKAEGNSAEINMMLIYLLRKAGLQADPVLIRTNDMGKPETIFPVHGQFNHVIALVTINNENYLLDATGNETSYMQLPAYDLHTNGWHVDNKDFGWIGIE